MSKTTKTATATATAAAMEYEARLQAVRDLLKEIGKSLDKHEARQVNDPRNWGVVGDLGYAVKQLVEVKRFIGGEG